MNSGGGENIEKRYEVGHAGEKLVIRWSKDKNYTSYQHDKNTVAHLPKYQRGEIIDIVNERCDQVFLFDSKVKNVFMDKGVPTYCIDISSWEKYIQLIFISEVHIIVVDYFSPKAYGQLLQFLEIPRRSKKNGKVYPYNTRVEGKKKNGEPFNQEVRRYPVELFGYYFDITPEQREWFWKNSEAKQRANNIDDIFKNDEHILKSLVSSTSSINSLDEYKFNEYRNRIDKNTLSMINGNASITKTESGIFLVSDGNKKQNFIKKSC